MRRVLLQRSLTAVLTVLLVSMLSFACLSLAPGDAASQALGEGATPAALAHWRHQYQLDQPVVTRYFQWLKAFIVEQGGYSLRSQQPVGAIIMPAVQRSGLLACLAACIMLAVGVSGGIVAALYPSRWPDRVIATLALAGLSTPEFIIASLLILLFSATLGWLPAVSVFPLSGTLMDYGHALLLPALTLGLMSSCYVIYMVRALLLEVVRSPWIRSARLNGVGLGGLLLRHMLPAVIGPLAQILATTLPYLFGGALVVERVFGYPGIGELLLNALNGRDTTLLQTAVVVCAMIASLSWLVADMVGQVSASAMKQP